MLSARNRMRRSEDFSDTLRRGTRGSARSLVVHLDANLTEGDPLVGFAVSRAVGNSVERHRVQRRLRHLMRESVGTLPSGSRTVVRALPAAREASHEQLRADLEQALTKALRRREGDGRRRPGGGGQERRGGGESAPTDLRRAGSAS